MKKLFWTFGGLFLATLALMTWSMAVVTPSDEDGQKAFNAAGCNMCHSVTSAGIEAKVNKGPMAGPDLTDVHKKHDAEWIAKYLRKEENLNGKAHAKEYKGSDEDLQTIINWVLAQTSE